MCPICYWTDADVWEFHRLRELPYCELYDQGFTIGGARQRLEGEEAKEDNSHYKQLIRQTIAELEEVLQVLKTH